MNMTETSRLILGLRGAGWSEEEIDDFLLYYVKPLEDQCRQRDA